MPRAFVIRPFGKKPIAKDRELDFDAVHTTLIGPALRRPSFGGGTTAEIKDAGNIHEDMFGLIVEADLVICDTIHNANVFYELGVRHALRKGRTVLIKGKAWIGLRSGWAPSTLLDAAVRRCRPPRTASCRTRTRRRAARKVGALNSTREEDNARDVMQVHGAPRSTIRQLGPRSLSGAPAQEAP